MVHPIEVFAMDANRQRVTGVIPYQSLIWHRRYYSSGEFSMEVSADVYSEEWAYIVTADRSETGVISKIEDEDRSDAGKGAQTVTVSGFFMEEQLNDKVIISAQDSSGAARDNVAQCMDIASSLMAGRMRVIPPDITGVSKPLAPSLERLGDFVFDELKTVEASVRVEYDYATDETVCYAWRGLDRTQSQNVNVFATFSDVMGTMKRFKGTRDDSNYRNKCFVLYEYEVPSRWNADGSPYVETIYDYHEETVKMNIYNRDTGEFEEREMTMLVPEVVGYKIPYQTVSGHVVARLDDGRLDKETYLDKTSDKPPFDELWDRETGADQMPRAPKGLKALYDAFPSSLVEDGMRLLGNDYPIIANVDTGVLAFERYMVEWDLGDKVDVILDEMGLFAEARIIGVTESYSSGRADIDVEIGNELMSFEKKARLV